MNLSAVESQVETLHHHKEKIMSNEQDARLDLLDTVIEAMDKIYNVLSDYTDTPGTVDQHIADARRELALFVAKERANAHPFVINDVWYTEEADYEGHQD